MTINFTIFITDYRSLIMFLRRNLRSLSSVNLDNLTRGLAFECLLPKTKQVKLAKVTSCTESSLHSPNPCALYSLPPEAQIQAWKEEITSRRNDPSLCIESLMGKFDFNALQDMLKIYTRKRIKAAVEQEIVWFGKEFSKPQMVAEHPTPSAVTDIQTMLYALRYDELLRHNRCLRWS